MKINIWNINVINLAEEIMFVEKLNVWYIEVVQKENLSLKKSFLV